MGLKTVALTVAFAVGAAMPPLVFAVAGRGPAERIRSFRARQRAIRIAGGIVMMAFAVGLVFDLLAVVQRSIPDYTSALQARVTVPDDIQNQLGFTTPPTLPRGGLSNCDAGAPTCRTLELRPTSPVPRRG